MDGDCPRLDFINIPPANEHNIPEMQLLCETRVFSNQIFDFIILVSSLASYKKFYHDTGCSGPWKSF